ncbi:MULTISPECIES: hypothetical protein [Dietzia]|jgi:hypothetical protein|uniref:Porin n=1 Tax=Dietzia maris TaxID=37915 RepID=A0ABT8GZR2_9ACTN|nr:MULTISPECIES: hypothetical protein [Dietzia]MBB0990798.1 hypothetical protein [Dietzia sp. SLG510A3-30A2]MBB1017462.1 hypothetical protein [Dietzia sp. DQ11-71]MCT1434754.1 hypothetical protein [Dietzia maris]MCT1521994.1 hypothetical protein [Dietzia maris]MCY1658140.1 hypothetical protein [Dietzia sp. SL131]
MPDFSAIGDLLGAIDDVLSGVMGFAGSLAGDGLDTVLGSLGEASE